MSNLFESFLKNIWMRTKHIEKSCVDLQDQSLFLKACGANFQDLEKDYLWRVLTNKDVE